MGLKSEADHEKERENELSFCYSGMNTVTITKMNRHIVPGACLCSGSTIFTFKKIGETNGDTREDTIKCPFNGMVVKRVIKKVGDRISPGDVLIFYEHCQHEMTFNGICVVCASDITTMTSEQQKSIAENVNFSMVHSLPGLKCTKNIAEDIGKNDMDSLLKLRKLVLLVDLDQTIIHSTNQNVPADDPTIFHYKLYGPHSQWYHTKFRPNLKEFLEEINKYYRLDVCTFGARRYAHQICHLIDPEHKYFPPDRILSRDEFFDPRSKTGNLNSLFPCGDSMVCIIDDRMDVWNYSKNVIHVKPYMCFKTDDINAPEKLHQEIVEQEKKEDQEQIDDDIEPEEIKEKYVEAEAKPEDTLLEDKDDYLFRLEVMLKKVHAEFFKIYDDKRRFCAEDEHVPLPELKSLIPSVRRQTLEGVNICFSGVIPTGVPSEQHRFHRLAESFGAKIQPDVVTDEKLGKTTHLVCAKWGSHKAKQAIEAKDIKLVTPYWLIACAERWEKVDESKFELTKETTINMSEFEDPSRIYFPYYEPTSRSSRNYDAQDCKAGPSRSRSGESDDEILEHMKEKTVVEACSINQNLQDEMFKDVFGDTDESFDSSSSEDDKEDEDDSQKLGTMILKKMPSEENEDDEDAVTAGWKQKAGQKRSRDDFDDSDSGSDFKASDDEEDDWEAIERGTYYPEE